MNSRLYECAVMHKRLVTAERSFSYRYFMFYLDLDEIDDIAVSHMFFSRNRFNVFSFRDRDHIAFKSPGVKDNILEFLRSNGIISVGKIFLLTNVAVFGYNFNPVSFYFCFSETGSPLCSVPEVGNTFGELKPFFLGGDTLKNNEFSALLTKHFYVSPFIPHDAQFDFHLRVPDDSLSIRIDDYKEGKKIFITHLSGKKQPLTDFNLLKYALKYPFVTLKVISAIHFQALLLALKKIPFFKKNEFTELQKGYLVKWKE